MFLLELDQYYLQLETKEELHIIKELLHVLTGYRTQEQLAKVLNVKQSFISDAKRRQRIPMSWLYKALEYTTIGEKYGEKNLIEYTKGHWIIRLEKDNIIYNYPVGTDVTDVKVLCKIYSGNKADTVLISYAPELLHCIKLSMLFLEQYHEDPYARYFKKYIQGMLRDMYQKV